MQSIITSNDISINIKYIDDEESHYQLNIPNNDINKKLIENTVFKFEKCGSVIIMHDDNNVFQLSKMECSYSDYIEMKDQNVIMRLELDQIKQELSNNNLLQQQINKKEIENLKSDINESLKIIKLFLCAIINSYQ
jgi:hypothetical protein